MNICLNSIFEANLVSREDLRKLRSHVRMAHCPREVLSDHLPGELGGAVDRAGSRVLSEDPADVVVEVLSLFEFSSGIDPHH